MYSNSLRVLAASLAFEIVRRELIAVERKWVRGERGVGLTQQREALRDRTADLLAIITETEL